VVSVSDAGTSDVYDLTVQGEHEFYANGILVHNSLDALRYILNSRPPVPLEDEEEDDDPHAVYAERRIRRAFAEEETSYAY